MSVDEAAKDIVAAAIKFHRALAPGLLESAYQACLAHELRRRQHRVECEVALSLEFEGVLIELGFESICNRPVGLSREQDCGNNSSHPPCTGVDLSPLERLVFGIDDPLERDLDTRRHPASGLKPS
ncbi:MAG: GxxExxY protein [Acidobacteria bacterium]|nr:GxxExxY protein [Acidobacteriota bacterium]